MALSEQELREREVYKRDIDRIIAQTEHEIQLLGATGYVEETEENGTGDGTSSLPSSIIAGGSAIKVFGPVSLNANYCQIPTNTSETTYPPKVVSPTGSRKDIQKVVGNWRETAGTQGLVRVDSPHFNFVHAGQNMLDPKMIHYLEKLFYALAPKLGVQKLTINSGFRSPAYQRSIGGVANSPHSCGWAVDIGATEATQFIIADAAHNMGFGGIAIGKGFVHIDISAYGRWDYGGIGFKYISPSQHKG